MAKSDLKNFTLPGLEAFLSGQGKERFRATQIFKWLYQKDARSFAEMTNLSKDLRVELEESACISNLEPTTVEMFGLKKPLPMIRRLSAMKSIDSKAIAKWPIAITIPPMRIAFLWPNTRSARNPPISGVK